MFRQIQKLQGLARRTISSTASRQVNRVKEKQKLFQEDNGLPVHLKGGAGDVILYRLTMTFAVFGTVYVMYTLYQLSFPQKKD